LRAIGVSFCEIGPHLALGPRGTRPLFRVPRVLATAHSFDTAFLVSCSTRGRPPDQGSLRQTTRGRLPRQGPSPVDTGSFSFRRDDLYGWQGKVSPLERDPGLFIFSFGNRSFWTSTGSVDRSFLLLPFLVDRSFAFFRLLRLGKKALVSTIPVPASGRLLFNADASSFHSLTCVSWLPSSLSPPCC